MINYRKLTAIAICLCSFSASQAQSKKTVTVPSSESFRNKVAQIQSCYMNSQTECGNENISNLYVSDNPKNYWQAITKSSVSHSATLPELPSNINYSSPQAKTTAQTVSTPPTTNNSSFFISDDDKQATGFVVG